MKNLKSLMVLALMLFVGGKMMGQGTFFIGGTFPMQEFGNYDNSEFALSTSGDNAGASIGFNAGIKWYFNVGVKGLNVLLSVDGIYNGMNAGAREFYKERKEVLDGIGSNVEMTTPKYINVPAMLGLNYTYHFNPNFGIFAEAGAGGNARFITNYTEGYTLSDQKYNAKVKYETAFSFAWQAGIGIEVAQSLVIGCSYYDLGKADVIANKTGEVLTTPMPADGASIHPSMFLVRIGFCF